MKKLATAIALSTTLAVTTAWSQGPAPVGDQFQINTYTTDTQRSPAVDADAQNNFVVVWGGYGPTNIGDYNVHAQRFDAAGAPQGDQFQVNTYTTSFQFDPIVAVAPQGDFIVVWGSSFSTSESNQSVQAQRFNSNGTALGNQFQINSYTTGWQGGASIAMDGQGNFILVWNSDGSTGSDSEEESIQVRLYDSTGTAMGNELQVNTYTSDEQTNPSIGIDSDGDFVVVWQSYGSASSDTSDYSIQGQRFSADGSTIGGQFQVNSDTLNNQTYPFVAVKPDGEFVVAWQSEAATGSDTLGYAIRAQRFSATAAKVGGEFQVNTYSTDDQLYPSISSDSRGDFVVVWKSYGSTGTDTSATSVQGQSFAATGSKDESEFQINTYTSSYQDAPSLVHRPEGDFLVVWGSKGGDGTDTGGNGGRSIQGQFFSSRIFADGFEAGNTLAWSATVP